MTELVPPNLYVELTKSINPQGCTYLSLDHSTCSPRPVPVSVHVPANLIFQFLPP
jgi:hypothetical protein